MKSGTKNVLRVVISLVYIIWGILSPITAIKAIIALDIGAIASAAVGVLTLLAGIFGLIGVKREKCRLFGIIIFVASLVAVVLSIVGGGFSVQSVITAILAWLFIACLK